MKSAPSVLLTVFIGKAKHKSSKMADVHNLINIPRPVCRPFPSGSLLSTILVIPPLHSFICFCFPDKYTYWFLGWSTVHMEGLLNCLTTWLIYCLKRLREPQATSLTRSHIHLLSGTLLHTVVDQWPETLNSSEAEWVTAHYAGKQTQTLRRFL